MSKRGNRIVLVPLPAKPRDKRPGFSFEPRTDIPLRGEGKIDYVCGHCSQTVAKNVELATFPPGFFLQCWKCQKYNEVPGADAKPLA
jgi:hypothetical protein